MPLDLMTMPPEEAERLAYTEGFTGTAALFARLVDAERERDKLAEEVESLRDDVCALESKIADLEAERDA